MIPQRSGRRNENTTTNNNHHPYNYESDEVITSSTAAAAANNNNNNSSKIYALAVPNASHRVVLLEMRVPLMPFSSTSTGLGPSSGPGSSSSDDVGIREIAHLEGLGYDDEFTERLCEHDDDDGDDDNDDEGRNGEGEEAEGEGDRGVGAGGKNGGSGGGSGYVLVAALVGANRRAIYRVPLAVPSRAGVGVGISAVDRRTSSAGRALI